jgi:hypothetical protein
MTKGWNVALVLLTLTARATSGCGSQAALPNDGGTAVADGGAAIDGGVREALTQELLGQRAFALLRGDAFDAYYDGLVATPADVRAVCPNRAGVEAYFTSGDGSRAAQQAAFQDCRARIDFARAAFRRVRTAPQRPLLLPPECPRSVTQSLILVELQVGSYGVLFAVDQAMELPGGWRTHGKLLRCGEPLSADGGVGSPQVSISAAPNPGVPSQPAAFTASLAGGSPPYASCQWRFEAGGASEGGTIAGSTCTGQHTYPSAGDYVASVLVTDSAARVGQAALSYRVEAGSVGGLPDLMIRPGVALVSPPPENRYAAGTPFQVAFTVKNIGEGGAPASVVRAALRDPVTLVETVLGDVPTGALASLAEVSLSPTLTIPAGQPAAVYDLLLTADGTGAIHEAREDNNPYVFLWITVR